VEEPHSVAGRRQPGVLDALAASRRRTGGSAHQARLGSRKITVTGRTTASTLNSMFRLGCAPSAVIAAPRNDVVIWVPSGLAATPPWENPVA
jgi:hypothetical protein